MNTAAIPPATLGHCLILVGCMFCTTEVAAQGPLHEFEVELAPRAPAPFPTIAAWSSLRTPFPFATHQAFDDARAAITAAHPHVEYLELDELNLSSLGPVDMLILDTMAAVPITPEEQDVLAEFVSRGGSVLAHTFAGLCFGNDHSQAANAILSTFSLGADTTLNGGLPLTRDITPTGDPVIHGAHGTVHSFTNKYETHIAGTVGAGALSLANDGINDVLVLLPRGTQGQGQVLFITNWHAFADADYVRGAFANGLFDEGDNQTLLLNFLASSVSAPGTLFGMTFDGELIEVNPAFGTGTLVRQLDEPFRGIDGLVYAHGGFYASYSGGRIVRFTLAAGSEVDLGDSGFPFVEDLAVDSTGRVLASVSQDGPVAAAESIGELDPLTGGIELLVQSSNLTQFDDMDAMAFDKHGELWVANLWSPSMIGRLDVQTGDVSSPAPITPEAWLTGLEMVGAGTFHASSVPDILQGGTSWFAVLNTAGTLQWVGPIGFDTVTGLTRRTPTWVSVGGVQTAASDGPRLIGTGTLMGGGAVSMSIATAPADAAAVLVIGHSRVESPWAGGWMVPTPHLLVPFPTDGRGRAELDGTWAVGHPSGQQVFLQAWFVDPAKPGGYAASNVLVATTP